MEYVSPAGLQYQKRKQDVETCWLNISFTTAIIITPDSSVGAIRKSKIDDSAALLRESPRKQSFQMETGS